jgi:hypothetical protein
VRFPREFTLDWETSAAGKAIDQVFQAVWRTSFDAPGFCVLNLEVGVDSHRLRAEMVRLKELLSEVLRHTRGVEFRFKSMARFDQQETTRFHLDGGPEQSLLMLGYEPSRVASRLFLADYTRAAFDLRMTPGQFLEEFNPMFRAGEERLGPHVTELPQPAAGQSRIILINNSRLPCDASAGNPLGILHKAEILSPSPVERRIINSTMLVVEGEDISLGAQQAFIRTDEISQKHY